jgi:hypothetical protein
MLIIYIFDFSYFCGWYKLPLETQYLVKFMIMRCNIPFQLAAGPFLNLNVKTFALVSTNSEYSN